MDQQTKQHLDELLKKKLQLEKELDKIAREIRAILHKT